MICLLGKKKMNNVVNFLIRFIVYCMFVIYKEIMRVSVNYIIVCIICCVDLFFLVKDGGILKVVRYNFFR